MTSFARYKPLYVSMSIVNDGYKDPPDKTYDEKTTPDNRIEARAVSQFNSPIIEKASDFLVAIERMEVSLNGVPFYDNDELPREYITVKNRTTNDEVVMEELPSSAYSLTHLFDILNAFELTEPTSLLGFRLTYSINKDGFIIITINPNPILNQQFTFNDIEIIFPPRLNMILGISTEQQIFVQNPSESNPTYVEAQSKYPRCDMGDDLDHIIIQSNLPTHTDAIGNAKVPLLTDVSAPSNYSNSLSYSSTGALKTAGFSSNIRQKLIYTPSERRYLELTGDFPIQDISVSAWYQSINYDRLGGPKQVLLPIGGIFEVKLGFYLRQ